MLLSSSCYPVLYLLLPHSSFIKINDSTLCRRRVFSRHLHLREEQRADLFFFVAKRLRRRRREEEEEQTLSSRVVVLLPGFLLPSLLLAPPTLVIFLEEMMRTTTNCCCWGREFTLPPLLSAVKMAGGRARSKLRIATTATVRRRRRTL